MVNVPVVCLRKVDDVPVDTSIIVDNAMVSQFSLAKSFSYSQFCGYKIVKILMPVILQGDIKYRYAVYFDV